MSHGTLTVVTGCMSCGKSEELIRRLRRAVIAKQPVAVFKPALDTRTDAVTVASRDGRSFQARAVARPTEILEAAEGMAVIGIDEAQFFEEPLVDVCQKIIARNGTRVIAAGLDTDFRGEPFETVARLLAVADEVVKLTAICVRCGSQYARHSQRLIAGRPAPYDAPRIMVGGDELYEPRCRDCFEINKP